MVTELVFAAETELRNYLLIVLLAWLDAQIVDFYVYSVAPLQKLYHIIARVSNGDLNTP